MNGQSLWEKSSISGFRETPEENKMILPEQYLAYTLSFDALKAQLQNVPDEMDKKKGISGRIIGLPLPDGTFERFEMYDSPVLAPKLAAKYPSIKSYKGSSLNTPGMNVRLDTGPYGFHAAIHGTSDIYYIDPYSRDNNEEYLTYDVKDHISQMDIVGPICGNQDEAMPIKNDLLSKPRNPVPISLHVYRFALSCTGEWGAIRGTVEKALADMNTGLNRINQIYENELAIRLVLIDENDALINLDPQTDPYFQVSEGIDMLNANTNITNLRVGVNSYDIGHVYHTNCDVGGVARLGSMCSVQSKAAAVTCHYSFNLNYMAAAVTSHEIGHQMSAQHTFDNCGGNEEFSNAFEPGSGSTIMSYGGLCGSNNVVSKGQGGDYYHVASLIQIYNHTRNGIAGDGCAENIETANIEPTVSILHDDDFYIPEDTYFFLEGMGADENEEDVLTYTWEQMNLGSGSSPLGQPIGDAPHFRSLPPSTSPVRYFPSPDNIIAGNFDKTEVAFKGDRTVNFMLTVRDNNAEAGTAVWDDLQFHVVETPVKFGITSQSTPETYTVGEEIAVTWNVAGTNLAPINTSNVDILLFTGTHLNFSLENTTVLAKNVFNTGQCEVIVPNEITQRGRIIVRAVDGNYFSINSRNITILPATSPKLIVNSNPLAQIDCTPSGSFTYVINTENLLGVEGDVSFTVLEGLPEGATATFEPETAETGTESILTIDPLYDPMSRDYQIRIGAITESMDTFTRLIYLNLKSSDHSELDAISPEKNAAGIGVTTSFSWSASPNADFYKFELSENPSFGSTSIESISGLTGLTYDSNIFLEKNTIYYWRVTASNYCGDDPLVKTFAFATESLFCSEVSPAEGVLPINISGSGLPTIQASIDVTISGNVADINVKQFMGEHENNKDLVVSLISPEGKTVVLVSKICEQQDFNCGFDDASDVNVKCPLNNGSVYKPVQNLSNFNGDPLEGTWILQIEDTRPGNGGRLEGLEVEFCSNQVLDNPFITRNEKLELPYDAKVFITSERLKAEDNNNSNDELVFTVVELPKFGELTFENNAISVGDQFSQKDIDENKLEYTSWSEDYSTYFSFTVIDGEGGFIGITNFEIEVNSTTSAEDKEWQDEINLFPIPARNLVTVDFTKSLQDYTSYEIINLQGQAVIRDNLQKGKSIDLDISQLSTGLYIIVFKSDNTLISKKIIVY
jgi:subtilisin-like proprotein convertase family protein